MVVERAVGGVPESGKRPAEKDAVLVGPTGERHCGGFELGGCRKAEARGLQFPDRGGIGEKLLGCSVGKQDLPDVPSGVREDRASERGGSGNGGPSGRIDPEKAESGECRVWFRFWHVGSRLKG